MVQSLPTDRFPNLVAASEDMLKVPQDEQFEFALKRLLDGIEADRSKRRTSGQGADVGARAR